jgi:predicted lysophospholipase L1 biosynthesis ABC-type transport system permease subunit
LTLKSRVGGAGVRARGSGTAGAMTFLLSGRDISLTIANIRKSEREGFSPFFYFSLDPIEFERAPKTYMATAYTTDTEKWKKEILARS